MRKTIVLDDFSGGDSGRTRPDPNDLKSYRGTNTWLYPSGIGPRPPLVKDTGLYTNGLPTGKRLRTFNIMRGQNYIWTAYSFSDGTIYSNDAAVTVPTAQTLQGTLGGFPNDSAKTSDVVYFCVETGAGGMVDSAGTFTSLPNMPVAQRIETFGARVVVMYNIITTPPTIRFSNAADPTTWDVVDSQFIGPAGLGMNLYVMRDALIIPKFDGTIWQFTGVIGLNEITRQIDVGRTHPYVGVADGAIVGGSMLYYVSGNRIVAFTGAQLLVVPRPDLAPPTAAGYTVKSQMAHTGRIISLGEDQHYMVLGTFDKDSDALTHVPWMQTYSPERGWNRHALPLTEYKLSTDAITSPSGTSLDSARTILADDLIDGIVAIVVPSDSTGGTNGTIRFYLFNSTQEMPYLTTPQPWEIASATNHRDGDTSAAVSASVQFAEWWSPDGSEVTVRSVQMDYTYDTDGTIVSSVSTPNTLTMSVLSTEPMDGTTVAESSAVTFVPTAGTAIDVPQDTTLKRGRELFQFGDQGAAGGFRIKIANWSGIVIRRLTITVDLGEPRV